MYEDNGKPTRVKSKTPPKKKGKAGLVAIIVLVLAVGAFIAVIALNLFNFREGVVMNYLRNAPLVGRFVPDAEEESDDIPLEQLPPEELAARIRALEAQIAALEEQLQEEFARARDDALRIARLLPFYEHWSEYQRVSAEFNQMIAHGDPEAFLRHVEYILPEFYAQLAQESMLLFEYRDAVSDIMRTLGNMQERAAAAILEDLRLTDLPLLAAVLSAMGNTMRGGIIEQMEPDIGSFMLRLIAVAEPVFAPLAPALFTPELPETYADLYEEETENDNGEVTENDE